ncbi:23S rRNA (guanosine(2251)-2'-O)-methyltransferase RlmB, partial [Candidatus Calescamantes bacterium]|nr:23S rRNA (guanosine(2251)-2'-O)-methyltransferase RlmB [Candidatus Calescamantes bacterium]MCK5599500.1 23S rRNA (guanosine(2251)-2'-O)-methyltransferase RlmB [bacterium]
MLKIIGRNAVWENLNAGNREIIKLVVRENTFGDKVQKIIELAKGRGIKIEFVSHRNFDSHYSPHSQGVVLFGGKRKFFSVEEMLKNARSNNEPPFILLLDRIQDVRNLGAIIRTAAALGVHGVIIPKHDSAKVTPEVERVSQGTLNRLMIEETVNLKREIKILKQEGVTILGLDMSGELPLTDHQNDSDGIALIMGGEAQGIRPGILKECDHIVSIPMKNDVESLNVSVAFGIAAFFLNIRDGG